ncbi:hypothetical protein [Sphingobium indicum]|nr:hypothetical protein [Sphingobium indicum]NYI22015.1 CYTH domain-containing protein [Sphingobium indicum]
MTGRGGRPLRASRAHEGRVREVDVFAGAAEGLVLAEVEFTA